MFEGYCQLVFKVSTLKYRLVCSDIPCSRDQGCNIFFIAIIRRSSEQPQNLKILIYDRYKLSLLQPINIIVLVKKSLLRSAFIPNNKIKQQILIYWLCIYSEKWPINPCRRTCKQRRSKSLQTLQKCTIWVTSRICCQSFKSKGKHVALHF